MDFMPWKARTCDRRDITELEEVSDGDTCWLETEQGDWERKVRMLRLRNVHAPEKKDEGWQECRAYVRWWLVAYDNKKKWPYIVDTYQTGTGRDEKSFGRFVADVWDAERRHCLNVDVQKFIQDHGYPGGTGA